VDEKRPIAAAEWSAPIWELWPIESEDDVTSVDWCLYQDRFRRAATEHGLATNLAAALSMALAEMADNVYQHAGGSQALGVPCFAGTRRSGRPKRTHAHQTEVRSARSCGPITPSSRARRMSSGTEA